MLRQIYNQTQALATTAAPVGGTSVPLSKGKTFSAQSSITVNTPSAKTFIQGTRQVQVIDFGPDVAGSLNSKYFLVNSINALTNASKGFYVWFNINSAGVDPAIAGRTGIQVAGATNISADDLVTAAKAVIDLLTNDFAACTASTSHLSFNNANPGAVTAAADGALTSTGFTFNTPSTAGVNSKVDPILNTISITSHGLPSGLLVRGTDTGTLPTGITTGVDYFVIVVDANTIQLASSLAFAQAGTAIDLTSYGSNANTGTLTPTALATATIQLQKSNDGTNWVNQGSSVSVTATGVYGLEWVDPSWVYARVYYSLAAGSFSASTIQMVQGDVP